MHSSLDVLERPLLNKYFCLLFHAFSLEVEVESGRTNFLNGEFGRGSWSWAAWSLILSLSLKSLLTTESMEFNPEAQ